MRSYFFKRTFNRNDQALFAASSGDLNPIHLDPVFARRTLAGAPIVHGIHSLLWMLECLAQTDIDVTGIKTLKAQFLRPIYIDEEVCLDISSGSPTTAKGKVVIGSDELLKFTIGFIGNENFSAFQLPSDLTPMDPPSIPWQLEWRQFDSLAGELRFNKSGDQSALLFPHASKYFGHHRVAALMSASCLVGMVIPGLHSLLLGVDVVLSDSHTDCRSDSLIFSTVSRNSRSRMMRVGIGASGIRGLLETQNRMPPVAQPPITEISSMVVPHEFKGAKALVVGGCRGLGAATARILAAGNADVTLTYLSGINDASELVREICRSGGKASALALDVRESLTDQMNSLHEAPTHIFYFATPPIFIRRGGVYDAARFMHFNSFYIDAYFNLLKECIRRRPKGVSVFFPSSSAIEVRPSDMTEYAMSKAAAEILSAEVPRLFPGSRVVIRRLPRLLTDQTNSTLAVQTPNVIETMLPIVREVIIG